MKRTVFAPGLNKTDCFGTMVRGSDCFGTKVRRNGKCWHQGSAKWVVLAPGFDGLAKPKGHLEHAFCMSVLTQTVQDLTGDPALGL